MHSEECETTRDDPSPNTQIATIPQSQGAIAQIQTIQDRACTQILALSKGVASEKVTLAKTRVE